MHRDGDHGSRRGAAALLLLPLLLAHSGCITTHLRSWRDFVLEPAGGTPHPASYGHFESCSGEWIVAYASDAPSPPSVLQQDGKSEEESFNVALLTGLAVAEGCVSVRFRALDGTFDQGGGLVWRAQGAADYYLARFNPLEGNVRLFVVRAGERMTVASAPVSLAAGWHEMAVDFDAHHVVVRLDGVARLETDHQALLPAGRLGVWTKADARTQFDDFLFLD
jgi:hypothetical protein